MVIDLKSIVLNLAFVLATRLIFTMGWKNNITCLFSDNDPRVQTCAKRNINIVYSFQHNQFHYGLNIEFKKADLYF